MREAWIIFKKSPLLFALLLLILFANWAILELLAFAGQKLGNLYNLIIHLSFLITFSGLQVGFINICMKLYTSKNPGFIHLFKYMKRGPNFLIAQLTYLLVIMIGMLLFLIPGFYLGAKFSFFGFDIAENNTTPMNSLRQSATLTKDMLGKLSFHYFLLILLNLFGAAWMGLGLFVTIPISVLTMTSLYKQLKTNAMTEA